MVMEYWSITMNIAIALGSIKPTRRNDSMVISHLLFADDMLIISKGDKYSAAGLNDSL